MAYTIITQATLEFLGLGNPMSVSLGHDALPAQNASAISVGAWWEVLVPAVAVAGIGVGLLAAQFRCRRNLQPTAENAWHSGGGHQGAEENRSAVASRGGRALLAATGIHCLMSVGSKSIFDCQRAVHRSEEVSTFPLVAAKCWGWRESGSGKSYRSRWR